MNTAFTPSRRFAAVLVLSLMALLLAFAMPAQAHAARTYGQLCSKYESGNNPADIDPGSAYGAYQMSPGNAYTFSSWLKDGAGKKETSADYATCVKWGTSLVSAYSKDGKCTGTNFDAAWKACAKENSELFFNLQYSYCKTHYYNVALDYWKKVAPGFDASDYSYALRNAIFSTAIQHGPYGSAYYVFKKALNNFTDGWKVGMAEDTLINAIYFERSRTMSTAPYTNSIQITKENVNNSTMWAKAKEFGIDGQYLGYFSQAPASWQVSIYNRLHNNERADAIALLLKYGDASSHAKTTGGAVTITKTGLDSAHKVSTTAIVCPTCDAVVQEAKVESISHSFIYSGASWKCSECGQAATAHSTSCYYRATATLNVRSGASTKYKVVTSLGEGKYVKPTAAKLSTDGYWWAKITISGKTGWVRMNYLSPHGTASSASSHAYSSKTGKCKYCGATKAQIAINKAGTYKAATKVTVYSAAYSGAKKVKTISAGTTIKVSKVVTNAYNNRWGKVSGGYVYLKNFKK